MRRTVLIFMVLILFVFVFSSCNNGVGETKAVSLSSIGPGGTLVVHNLSAKDLLELTDYSLKDGIYLEVGNSSRAIASRGGVDDENLCYMESGSFIPVPDSTGTSVFSASKLGIQKDADVVVYKMPQLDDDFRISSEEPAYVGHRGLVEEYYYVDFNDPRWADLDRSEIVVAMNRSGAAQGKVIQHGFLSFSLDGLYDFSDPSIEGFGLYMYSILEGDSQSFIEASIINPMHPDSSPISFTGDRPVLLIDRQEPGEYKLEISVSGDDAQSVCKAVVSSGYYNAYLTDGSYRPGYVIRELDFDNCILTYHLGAVDEPFLITLEMEGFITGFSGGSVRLLRDEPGVEFHDISDLGNPIIVKSGTGDSVTWAFRSEIEQVFEIVTLDKNIRGMEVSVFNASIPPEKTGVLPRNTHFIPSGSIGCITLHYEGLPEGTDLLMIRSTSQQYEQQKLECDVIRWDPDSLNYVCDSDDCPVCGADGQKKHYNLPFMALNAQTVLNGCYVTEESYDGFGRIGYENGNTIRLMDLGITLNNSTSGNISSDDPYGTYAWSSTDTSKKVEIRLKQLSVSGKRIVCDITIGDSEKYENVVMSLTHKHVWQFSDGYATCQSCGERRACVSRLVGPGGPYHIEVNGTAVVVVPEKNYTGVINGSMDTPELDDTVMVYFMPASTGYTIKEFRVDNNDFHITLEEL